MANAAALPEQLIYLIIRFTASVPDLPLTIHTPRTIATLSLKQLIRAHLPPEHASARLRLIYAGKVLVDTEPLATSLRLGPPPPRKGGYGGEGSKSKGKQPLREAVDGNIPQDAKKFYIHCSLGDALTPSELSSETTLAQNTEIALQWQYETAPSFQQQSSSSSENTRRRSSTTGGREAQGFDRLLSSGFTASEVASLRSHFTTNLSFTHIPDTMPTPSQIRLLEDRWLDSSANDPSSSLTSPDATGENGWGAGFAVEEGGLDDMLYGYLTGFFFPLGSLIWGFREEGVWTRRRQVAVVMGVGINAVFGFMRWGG